MRGNKLFHVSVVSLVMLYLFLPLFATFLYSVATDWYRSILPEGYTLAWYRNLFSDPRFLDALGRTLFVSVVSILISVITMLPAIFVVTIYFPKWERVLQGLALLPYAVPGVVEAVALIKIYSNEPLVLSGTIWILIGGFFVILLPYMYQGIRNSLRTVDAVKLMDAAELLGAGKWQAFRLVVLPNIWPGIVVSILLSFSILFGEFVLANLLVGGYYELVQVYLMRRMNESGHLASAIVVVYFVLILVVSGLVLKFGQLAKEAES